MTEKTTSNSKPPWLKVRACGDKKYLEVQSLIKNNRLHTVCSEANCPNRGECFSSGTATFLILGPNCSRNCAFCNINTGELAAPDDNEPSGVARAVDILGLKYAVVTSVTRDDLPDGGAGQFAAVIAAIRALERPVRIEVLTPDFKGDKRALETVFVAGPDVFNHNVETVPRLYPEVRPAADYGQSLEVLRHAADYGGIGVKSGLMVGLGESEDELVRVFEDMVKAGVAALTIGQYLSPSKDHYPVKKYYHPSEFDLLGRLATEAGIAHVFSAPLVRSSYHAAEQADSLG
jgi:lipoic acid synthetase